MSQEDQENVHSLMSPFSTIASYLSLQIPAHSGTGTYVHFFLPEIWACQDGRETPSIWGEIYTVLY